MTVRSLLVLLMLTDLAFAQTEPASSPPTPPAVDDSVDRIVVTASRTPQPRAMVTSAVDVMSAEEIEFSRYDNVAELLRRFPGVHIEQPGSRGSRSSVYLRGLDPNHTVILVDGIRLNDSNNNLGGSFDLSTLDTDNVERIEIVRGPLSAVHGSDAIAGAINIITRTGRDGDEAIIDASGGRFGYARGVATLRGQRGIFDGSVSGSFVHDGEPESDSTFRSGNLNSSFGVELPGEANLRGTLRYVDAKSRAYPQASGGEKHAVFRDRDTRKARELSMGLVFDQPIGERFETKLGVDYYRRREKRDTPAIAPPPGNPFAGIPAQEAHDLLYRTHINGLASFAPIPQLTFSAGADVTFESGNSIGELAFGSGPISTSYNQDRIIGGPFVEGVFESEFGLSLQAGLRMDASDESDTQWTPRAGAAYAIPRTPVTLRGSWGEGFKLPAFYSLADPLIGNPDLVPEKSRGWDVGFEARFFGGRVQLDASYFEIHVKDLIDFDFSTFSLVNRQKVTTKGVEVGLVADLPWDVTLTSAITRARTNIKKTSDDLLRRPGWRGHAGIEWRPAERFTFGVDALWVGSVHDESLPTGPVKLDDYWRFDLRGDVRVWREVHIYLAIDNFTDANYEEAVGVPAMGIRPRAGMRAVF